MIRKLAAPIAFLFSLAAVAAQAEDYAPMKPFETVAGKFFRGEGVGDDGAPFADDVIFEYILGGRALQSTHRLEDGSYGGRSIVFYDESARQYIFHYFTTAGFHSTGTFELRDDGFDSIEHVAGHENVAEVRGRVTIGDGVFTAKNVTINKDGTTQESEPAIYREVSERPVLFGDGS